MSHQCDRVAVRQCCQNVVPQVWHLGTLFQQQCGVTGTRFPASAGLVLAACSYCIVLAACSYCFEVVGVGLWLLVQLLQAEGRCYRRTQTRVISRSRTLW
jgi:hypothetical protein